MVRLGVDQVEEQPSAFACLSGLIRLTDDLDDLVNVEDCHEQALPPGAGGRWHAQAEFGAAADHVQTVVMYTRIRSSRAEGSVVDRPRAPRC